jgi:hypothetical protein
MVHRGLIFTNASPAVVFRSIEAWAPTLLLDEADTWMSQDLTLAGILNGGHTRRTANVLRVEEAAGELKPRRFKTWCPIVIAGIGSQRDTLMSRSIVIGLRRKLAHETVAPWPTGGTDAPHAPRPRLPMDLFEQSVRRHVAGFGD